MQLQFKFKNQYINMLHTHDPLALKAWCKFQASLANFQLNSSSDNLIWEIESSGIIIRACGSIYCFLILIGLNVNLPPLSGALILHHKLFLFFFAYSYE